MLHDVHGAVVVQVDAGDFTSGIELAVESTFPAGAVRRQNAVGINQVGQGVHTGISVGQIQIAIPGFIVGNYAAVPDGGPHCQLAGGVTAAIVGPHHLRRTRVGVLSCENILGAVTVKVGGGLTHHVIATGVAQRIAGIGRAIAAGVRLAVSNDIPQAAAVRADRHSRVIQVTRSGRPVGIHRGGIDHQAAGCRTSGVTVARATLHLRGYVVVRHAQGIAVRDLQIPGIVIRVDYHRAAGLGGVGFPVHRHHQIFTVYQVCGDRTINNRRGIRGGLGSNRRRGGRDAGIDVQHKAIRFRVVTGFVGDAQNVSVIPVEQAVVLIGPACAAVHCDLTQQDPVPVKLHDFAVFRSTVKRTVDQR